MISLKWFLLIGVMMSLCTAPMNFSFDFGTVYQVADILANVSSSYFPGSSFLNYVLYGSENATYSYKDFLQLYGLKVSNPYPGDIIIGKDFNLGGILNTFNTIVIPVPSGKVQSIPQSLLKKYFPKGYQIKRPVYSDYSSISYL